MTPDDIKALANGQILYASGYVDREKLLLLAPRWQCKFVKGYVNSTGTAMVDFTDAPQNLDKPIGYATVPFTHLHQGPES